MSLLRQFQPQLPVASQPAQDFQRAIDELPDPNIDPKAYRTAIANLNDKFADFLRLKVQVNLVELSEQDPDEFMKVMPKILDNFIPKMKSVESKVEAIIDTRVYVETAYREPVPIDALKRAGVVIDSEAGPVAQGDSPEDQSPFGSSHSHPASSAPLTISPKALATLNAAATAPNQLLPRLSPVNAGAAALALALSLDDEDVLS